MSSSQLPATPHYCLLHPALSCSILKSTPSLVPLQMCFYPWGRYRNSAKLMFENMAAVLPQAAQGRQPGCRAGEGCSAQGEMLWPGRDGLSGEGCSAWGGMFWPGKDAQPGEGCSAQGGMLSPGRDGQPREGCSVWGGMLCLGRDAVFGEGCSVQGRMLSPGRDASPRPVGPHCLSPWEPALYKALSPCKISYKAGQEKHSHCQGVKFNPVSPAAAWHWFSSSILLSSAPS